MKAGVQKRLGALKSLERTVKNRLQVGKAIGRAIGYLVILARYLSDQF